MKKIIVFLLTVLLSLSMAFPAPGSYGGVGPRVYLSFEHYKMKDGWTPVVLSIGDLHCLLWMDETGGVSELREPGAHDAGPVCLIDVSTQSLRRETNVLYFEMVEQNSVRTRWRLSRPSAGVTAETVTEKILFREKSGVDLCLGPLRLPLKHVARDIEEFSPGLYNVRFYGPMVRGSQPLVYEKATGMIHSPHHWNNRLIPGRHRTRAPQSVTPAAAASIPAQERAALIALYNSTDGDNWYDNWGWKTPPLAADGFALPGTENTWTGIICDPDNTTVQEIYLLDNNLTGPLPPELGNLVNLLYLDLFSNQISGGIPPELGNLAQLQELSLLSNQLSGTIPPELGNLLNLLYLDFGYNQLSGAIPPQLGNLVNLNYCALYGNQLSGAIPPELGNLAILYTLDLNSNQLGGAIPPELGNLAYLQVLGIENNLLTGAIPPELGNLADLQNLSLSSNQLTGAIPPELGNLLNLEGLYLYSNQLSGVIPAAIGNLVNLRYMDLNNNRLSGSIPPAIGNLANLKGLYLYSNQLSGAIPPQLGNLASLQYLFLYTNQLSGSIPPELGNPADLQRLSLYSNQLSGSIPPELGNAANLYDLKLSYNQLSGSIPPELGNLVYLYRLDLGSNGLSGSIPSTLTNLVYLWNGGLNLKWNALFTGDEILKDFLDSKQEGGNWVDTQTVAPLNVTAASLSNSSIDIRWTPITYTSDTGGYRVFYSATPGGPYTYAGMTADKLASSLNVGGLIPGNTYYFVVQSRTNPHANNQDTVDSQYSAEVPAISVQLILTSPNGGESWGLGTFRNITWTSSGLSGNIRLELWKAGKKLAGIAANIPIGNGKYTWLVGNYGPAMAPLGNDYKVKIITADGLYSDTGNTKFSIVQGFLTLTSPRAGESWQTGTARAITWTSLGLTGNVRLLLFKDGVQMGVIARGIPIANGAYTWTVGKHSLGVAPPGGNYTVKIRSEDNQTYNSGSGAFAIR